MSERRNVDSEPAFILHARNYRETSQLLEAFTHNHGRIGLVAKGARRSKSPFRGALRLFQPLSISWSGRGDLATLRIAECSTSANNLVGTALMAGFYVNELILTLLHRSDPHRDLFAHYTALLAGLADAADDVEVVLRRFEMALLSEIGYGLSLDRDSVHHAELSPSQRYEYRVERGPVPVDATSDSDMVFTGVELLAIGRGDFAEQETLSSAKRLLRNVLEHHLGGRPLKTRKVFASMKRRI
jgi:DNA repair protein RecO (recombination protein O)